MKKLIVGLCMILALFVLSGCMFLPQMSTFDEIKEDYVNGLRPGNSVVEVKKDLRDTEGRVTNMLLVVYTFSPGAAHGFYHVKSWTYKDGFPTSAAEMVGSGELRAALRRALRKKSGLYEDEAEWDLDAAEFHFTGRGIHAYFAPYQVGDYGTGLVHVKLDIELP